MWMLVASIGGASHHSEVLRVIAFGGLIVTKEVGRNVGGRGPELKTARGSASPRRIEYFDWDDAKNAKLRAERGIGFEDIVFHIERGDVLDILENPNPDRYAGQRIFVVRREDLVPFMEDEHTVFLKTIIPSRKATKEYLGEESDHED
jgi:uncharacterized DUF497 family protein